MALLIIEFHSTNFLTHFVVDKAVMSATLLSRLEGVEACRLLWEEIVEIEVSYQYSVTEKVRNSGLGPDPDQARS